MYIKYPTQKPNTPWRIITYNDSIEFAQHKKHHVIDSAYAHQSNNWYFPGNTSFKYPARNLAAGTNELSFTFYLSNGHKRKITERLFMVSDSIPIQVRIEDHIKVPHDEKAFTQGLLYWNKLLYESTGLRGESTLRIINPVNGQVLKKQALPDSVFSEGIALYDNALHSLTWKDSLLFKFDWDLIKLATQPYPKEGWGLTTIDNKLLASDGTDRLYYLHKNNYQVDSSFQVFNHLGPVYYLNELEYIHNRIWANVLGKDVIVIIDPATGQVVAEIDVAPCINRKANPQLGALNGIAYNEDQQTVYLTGKNWPFMLVWRPSFFVK